MQRHGNQKSKACDLPGVVQNTKPPSSLEIREKKIRKIPHPELAPQNTKNIQKFTNMIFFFLLGGGGRPLRVF